MWTHRPFQTSSSARARISFAKPVDSCRSESMDCLAADSSFMSSTIPSIGASTVLAGLTHCCSLSKHPFALTLRLLLGLKALSRAQWRVVRQAHHERLSERHHERLNGQYWGRAPLCPGAPARKLPFSCCMRSFIRAAATAAKISNRSPGTTIRSGCNSFRTSVKPVGLKPTLLNLDISEVKFRRQAHVSSDDFQCQLRVVLDTLHDPAHQAVLGSSAGNKRRFSSFIFLLYHVLKP